MDLDFDLDVDLDVDLDLDFEKIFVEPDELLKNDPDKYIYLLKNLIIKLFRKNNHLCVCGKSFTTRYTRERHLLNNNCRLFKDNEVIGRLRDGNGSRK